MTRRRNSPDAQVEFLLVMTVAAVALAVVALTLITNIGGN